MLVGNKTDLGEQREVTLQVALDTGSFCSPRGDESNPKAHMSTHTHTHTPPPPTRMHTHTPAHARHTSLHTHAQTHTLPT